MTKTKKAMKAHRKHKMKEKPIIALWDSTIDTVRIGSFTIRCQGESVYIENDSGEGGEFPAKHFEEFLKTYFCRWF